MGCGLNKSSYREDLPRKGSRYNLNQQELLALSMIYRDIASRHPYSGIDFQNFQHFFRKNGSWAENMFKQFDVNGEGLLTQSEFIRGIANIYKSSEEDKARRLFVNFASASSNRKQQGIRYKDFLRILYNYPKSDLKEILHDEYFFEEKLKRNLFSVSNNEYRSVSRVPEKESVIFGLVEDELETIGEDDHQKQNQKKEQDGQKIQKDENRERGSKTEQRDRTSGGQKKGRISDIEKKMNASLTFFLYNKKLNIKMTSIHALVRKYAEMIFNELKIDIKTGLLTEQDFIQWVLKHTNLYKNYYSSFHDYVWAYRDGHYQYLNTKPEIKSKAKMCVDKTVKKVELMNIKGMLIVHEPGERQKLVKIVYLQGLKVAEIPRQNKKEGGFAISHHNGVYPEVSFLFSNGEIVQGWMNVLSSYKGITIYKDFHIGKRIGAGKFSVVYEGIQISTNKVYAIKEIETYKLSEQAKNILKNEKYILSKLDHPSFPKFYKHYQSKTHTHIVMELIDGIDLYEYLKKNGNFQQLQGIQIVKSIIIGVRYLQKMGIVHRDLKPDNIILINKTTASEKYETKIKIIDFGFSIMKECLKDISVQENSVGTPNFIPPEFLPLEYHEENYDNLEKSDNFAVGCITYYILTGHLPFLANSIEQVFHRTATGQFDINNKNWKKLSKNAKNFIESLLQVNPDKRMDLLKALKHPWIQEQVREVIEHKKQKKNTNFASQALLYE